MDAGVVNGAAIVMGSVFWRCGFLDVPGEVGGGGIGSPPL